MELENSTEKILDTEMETGHICRICTRGAYMAANKHFEIDLRYPNIIQYSKTMISVIIWAPT